MPDNERLHRSNSPRFGICAITHTETAMRQPLTTCLRLIAIITVATLAAGCPASPITPSAYPLPSVAPPLPSIAPPSPAPRSLSLSKAPTARVLDIIDGDTIKVLLDGRAVTVRYIGIDTPETVAPNQPIQPYGPEAAAANRALLHGQTVRLERDTSDTDQYGRLLRYVWLGDLLINAELVRLGYARVRTYPPDTQREPHLRQLEAEARAARRGLWSLPPTSTPAPPEPQSKDALTGPCPRGCATPPPGCAIKGNINSNDERIYHLPNCRDYNRTIINPAAGERWFCTEPEALANAWRKALNCP
jgi:micrococcal nuclease